MCMFCAAIPVAATTGLSLNNKQLQARRAALAAGHDGPHLRPIMVVTAGVIFLLFVGSATYHTLTWLP